MTLPRPEHFSDWKAWAAELIRREGAEPLAVQVARLLKPIGGVSAEYDRKLGVITLNGTDSVNVGNVIGLDDYIFAEMAGALTEGNGVDILEDSISGGITISAGMTIYDETVSIDNDAYILKFVGSGVDATTITGGVQVSIPGGGGGVAVRDEGSTLTAAAGFLDFVGTGVTATTVSGGVQVSVPGGGGSGDQEGADHVIPNLADFSWVNQGSATATQQTYAVTLKQPRLSNGGGSSWVMLVRSTPSTPYTIKMRLKGLIRLNASASFGPLWRASGSGAFQVLRYEMNGGFSDPAFASWSSVTTWSSNTVTNQRMNAPCEWFALVDDGTNRSLRMSPDGEEWLTFWSGARTTHITPDQVGFGINNYPNSDPAMDAVLRLMSWEQT